MLRIHYEKEGNAINDFYIDHTYRVDIVAGVHDGRDDDLHYSTENIFARIRLGIVTGEISFEDVVFVFEDEELKLNKYGALLNWPEKFCQEVTNISEKILRAAFAMHKAEHPEKY